MKNTNSTDGKCGQPTQVYSRVCGYYTPVNNWNKGKFQEFKERKVFNPDTALAMA